MVYLQRTNDGVTRITGESNTGIPKHLKAWPVGSIFMCYTEETPDVLLGGGTWIAFGEGRVLVGYHPSDPPFNGLGNYGGEKSVTLTPAEMPAHNHGSGSLATEGSGSHAHSIDRKEAVGVASGFARGNATAAPAYGSDSSGFHGHSIFGVTGETGGGGAHNNIQPFLVVKMWRRTA